MQNAAAESAAMLDVQPRHTIALLEQLINLDDLTRE
jgi:hypothetical protein